MVHPGRIGDRAANWLEMCCASGTAPELPARARRGTADRRAQERFRHRAPVHRDRERRTARTRCDRIAAPVERSVKCPGAQRMCRLPRRLHFAAARRHAPRGSCTTEGKLHTGALEPLPRTDNHPPAFVQARCAISDRVWCSMANAKGRLPPGWVGARR